MLKKKRLRLLGIIRVNSAKIGAVRFIRLIRANSAQIEAVVRIRLIKYTALK